MIDDDGADGWMSMEVEDAICRHALSVTRHLKLGVTHVLSLRNKHERRTELRHDHHSLLIDESLCFNIR